jgi:hypothetical protein
VSSNAEGGGQRRPEDHADLAGGSAAQAGQGSARPVREFRMSGADRVGNAIFCLLGRPVSGRPIC